MTATIVRLTVVGSIWNSTITIMVMVAEHKELM